MERDGLGRHRCGRTSQKLVANVDSQRPFDALKLHMVAAEHSLGRRLPFGHQACGMAPPRPKSLRAGTQTSDIEFKEFLDNDHLSLNQ